MEATLRPELSPLSRGMIPGSFFSAFDTVTLGASNASGAVVLRSPVPYDSVNVPPVALTEMSCTVLEVASSASTPTWPSGVSGGGDAGLIVTVAATEPSGAPGVELTTLPIAGVSFRSPGSMTGSRSRSPVRSLPTLPLTNSGPWTLFSCASCGANTLVSPPSTRSFSNDRTQTVRGMFQLVESKLTC